MVWKDSYYMPNNKETDGLIFNSEDKKIKYFQKPFFPRNRTKWGQIKLMWRGMLISFWKWIYHIFREMRLKSKRGLWHCIFCSNGHWFQCLFKEIYSFLARDLAMPILRQTNHISVTSKFYSSHWMLGNMTIFHLITPYITKKVICGKFFILFHPSPKNITKRCRSPSWKLAERRW